MRVCHYQNEVVFRGSAYTLQTLLAHLFHIHVKIQSVINYGSKVLKTLYTINNLPLRDCALGGRGLVLGVSVHVLYLSDIQL